MYLANSILTILCLIHHLLHPVDTLGSLRFIQEVGSFRSLYPDYKTLNDECFNDERDTVL